MTSLRGVLERVGWSAAAAFCSKISVVFAGIVVARTVGAEALGTFGLAQSAIVMLASVAAQSIATATAKHVGEFHGEDPRHALLGAFDSLLFALAVAFVLVGAAALAPAEFNDVVLGASDSGGLLALIMLIVALNIVAGWIQGVLTGYEKYRALAISNLWAAGIGLPSIAVLTMLFGVLGALSGLALMSVCQVGGGLMAARPVLASVPFRGLGRASRSRGVISGTALPVLLTGLMVAPTNWAANRMLMDAPGGAVELGIFVASFQLSAVFSQVSLVLGNALLPMLSRRQSGRQIEAINMLLGWVAVLIVAIPAMALPELVGSIYGTLPQGQRTGAVIAMVLLGAVIVSYKGGISRKIVAANLSWFSVVSNFAWAILFLCLCLEFRAEGAVGIAKAFLTSHVAHFMCSLPVFLWKRVVSREFLLSGPVAILWSTALGAFLLGTTQVEGPARLALVVLLQVVAAVTAFVTIKSTSNVSVARNAQV